MNLLLTNTQPAVRDRQRCGSCSPYKLYRPWLTLILVELKGSLDAYRGLSIFHLVPFFGETECGLGRCPLNVPLAGHPQGLPDRASLIAVQLSAHHFCHLFSRRKLLQFERSFRNSPQFEVLFCMVGVLGNPTIVGESPPKKTRTKQHDPPDLIVGKHCVPLLPTA